MAGDSGPSEAVKAAQLQLQSSTPTLIVDGRWGEFTNAAYERAPEVDRIAVDGILASFGFNPSGLIRQNRAEKAAKSEAYLAAKMRARTERSRAPNAQELQAVNDALTKASQATGVSRSWLVGFAQIESGLDAKAVNGSSRGLMAIQPGAWQDVQKVDPSIGQYQANVFDPEKNALAGARYLQLNQKRLVTSGYTGPITPAVLYLAHQQGAAGFVELWKASRGLTPTTNYVTARKMTANPPQDRQGVTTDKAAFFRRWLAVAERKLGSN